MDIAVKYRIISEIIRSEDDRVLNEVKSLLKIQDESDFWVELNDDQKREIKNAMRELDEGQKFDYEDFMSKHR